MLKVRSEIIYILSLVRLPTTPRVTLLHARLYFSSLISAVAEGIGINFQYAQ